MFRYAVVAAVGALACAGAAKALSTLELPKAAAAEPAPLLRGGLSDAAYAPGPQAASITKASDGHFWAEGVVNGARVRFLVDTGASAVALTLADARRLGFEPRDLTFDAEVQTASGKARVARVSLDSVSVAGARVRGVDAFVVDKGLETSLLGMTYLGRLARFEATQGSLILRP